MAQSHARDFPAAAASDRSRHRRRALLLTRASLYALMLVFAGPAATGTLDAIGSGSTQVQTGQGEGGEGGD